MRKDLDKLFGKSIETYYFLLVIIVIIKLLGGNYFGIVYTNKTINIINDFIMKWKLENVWYAITLYVYTIITISITCNDNSKKMKVFCLCCMPVIIALQFTKNYTGAIGGIIDFCYLFVLAVIYNKINKKDINKITIKNYIAISVIGIFAQMFSMIVRNQDLRYVTTNFYTTIILNLDYIILLIIVYKLYFMKGGNSLCQMVVSSGSQKLISLRDSLLKLRKKFLNKKPKSKEEKITFAIYYPLYLLWNLFTMLIIVLIAFLNDAFVETIFITVAFWVNKRSFGKPFHFKSVAVCFTFSSLTYYILTRITFKTETSFFIPIFLGVALSYVTSHFIKKNIKLYKGMTREDLYATIVKVTDDPIVIKICEQYYCDRLDDRKIARNVSYSIDSVRKKRQQVNKDLRNL